MKMKCDICDGELMMNVGGKSAVCICCGMNYSIERMKEKMKQLYDDLDYREMDAEEMNSYWFECTSRIVVDRNKLKSLIRVMDHYENLDRNVKLVPHHAFREVFYKDELWKLKENERVLYVENMNKKDVEQLFIEFENILECKLKLTEIKEDKHVKFSKEEDFIISKDNDEEIEIGVIKEYIGDASIIEIPKEVEYFGQYQDGIPVFRNPKIVREIHIPNNITTLGSHALYGCENLEEMIIPSCVEYIGYSLNQDDLGYSHTFDGCTNLKRVKFDVNAWNDYDTCKGLFKNCVNLKEVILPNTISCIPEATFENCENLEEIIIPDKVCVISKDAFKGCKNLKRVYFPKHDMIIHPSAFENTNYQPPIQYVSDKAPKRCPVCGGRINLWHTCKKCDRQIEFC